MPYNKNYTIHRPVNMYDVNYIILCKINTFKID